MKRTILVFGLASGALSAAMMSATVPFMNAGSYRHGYLIGYTAIVLASLLVFFGVRSYRERNAAARLTFLRGLAVGASIAAVSAICYAGTWVVLSTIVYPDLWEKVATQMVDQKRADGATPAEIDATAQEMKQYVRMAKNPAVNFGMALMEPLPIGILVSLISAAILRRKGPSATVPNAGARQAEA